MISSQECYKQRDQMNARQSIILSAVYLLAWGTEASAQEVHKPQPSVEPLEDCTVVTHKEVPKTWKERVPDLLDKAAAVGAIVLVVLEPAKRKFAVPLAVAVAAHEAAKEFELYDKLGFGSDDKFQICTPRKAAPINLFNNHRIAGIIRPVPTNTLSEILKHENETLIGQFARLSKGADLQPGKQAAWPIEHRLKPPQNDQPPDNLFLTEGHKATTSRMPNWLELARSLEIERTISGTVVDGFGNRVSDVFLSLGKDQAKSILTPDGSFLFTNLGQGEYELYAIKDGYFATPQVVKNGTRDVRIVLIRKSLTR